jgi:hypothetical protein
MRSLEPIFAASVFLGAVAVGAEGAVAALGPWSRIAETARITGQVRTDYFRSSKTLDDEIDFLGVTTQLKALPEFSPLLDAKIEARVTNPAVGERMSTHTSLLEGYVGVHFSRADLRLGRQIVAWGRADGINPTDNLTPRDYVVLLPFEDDQRFGTTAAKLDVFLTAEKTLTVFASPYFEPNKLPLSNNDSSIEQKLPPRTFSNTQFGVRMNKSGEGFDWSLSYFYGFNLLPSLRLTDGAEGTGVQAHCDRIRVFGGDIARNFGRFGFRGEIAYVDTMDRAGSDSRVLNPNLFFIAGVDRTFFANLNLNLQYFRRQVRRFHPVASIPDPLTRRIASESALLTAQRNRASGGVSFRISNKWLHDTLEAEIFGVINFTTRDSFARPQVSYAFTDHWKVTVGYDWFDGERDTQFGSLASNRGTFVETRFSF